MPKQFNSTYWRIGKILTIEQAQDKAAKLKKEGKKIVTVNGSFDLLHIGHLDQLEQAKRQGDVLFIGINSDRSIAERKGKNRPVNPEEARAAMLAALACVDFVTIIDSPYSEMQNYLLRAIKPDIHVNGPDYGEPSTWIEWPVMREVEAKGYTAKKLNNFSTTELIDKIKNK